jgi:protein-S-isoprenylcysteine O-methyltransferase Ste14
VQVSERAVKATLLGWKTRTTKRATLRSAMANISSKPVIAARSATSFNCPEFAMAGVSPRIIGPHHLVGVHCQLEFVSTQNKTAKMGPIARIVLVIGGTAAYFVLAILGWGGVAAFFSHPALVALAVATAILVAVAYFAGGSLSPGVREDRSNRWVVGALGVIGLLLGFVPACTDRIGIWTIDGDSIRWFGIALYLVGGALRLWPVFVLGHRFSGLVAIQPGHTLVTSGIYGVIRHPSYLGLLLNSLGWALAFRSGVGVLLGVALMPLLMARIRSEEALLLAQFGAEYDAYRARTSRLIPGVY